MNSAVALLSHKVPCMYYETKYELRVAEGVTYLVLCSRMQKIG